MTRAQPTLPPGSTIGVLGAGQLGRMFAQVAVRLGYEVHVYAPDAAGSPAAVHAARVVTAPWEDLSALSDFARACDAVTLEFENVPTAAVEAIEHLTPVRPGPGVLAVAQDRLAEKRYLAQLGIPVAPWRPVASREEAHRAVLELGRPGILKTARLGYDGKGQRRIEAGDDPASAWDALGSTAAVYEVRLDLAAEFAILVARSAGGEVVVYPAIETRHVAGILDVACVPAQLPASVVAEAREAARRLAVELDVHGIVCLEAFLTQDGRWFANEIAPRPHNSAHLTLEASVTSQFEQQLRAVANLPLGDPRTLGAAAMCNLLGEHMPREDPSAAWARVTAIPGVAVHLYGKREVRKGRKMGHLTLRAETPEAAVAKVCEARATLRTKP